MDGTQKEEKDNGIRYFSFFRSYFQTAELIEEAEQRLQFYENILRFMFLDNEPQGTPMQLALFEAVRPTLQKSRDKIAAGRKGGKAKQTASKTKQPESNLKQTESKTEQRGSETGKDKGIKDKGIKDKGVKEKGITDKGVKEKYYPNDEELEEAFRGYIDFRREIKKPMTDRAIDLAMMELNNLSGGDSRKAILILNQSVVNGWQGLFPLKGNESRDNPVKAKPETKKANFQQRKYDFDALEKKLLSGG